MFLFSAGKVMYHDTGTTPRELQDILQLKVTESPAEVVASLGPWRI